MDFLSVSALRMPDLVDEAEDGPRVVGQNTSHVLAAETVSADNSETLRPPA